jgi:hypothetical protein
MHGAVAGYGRDHSGREIDTPDGVAFGIGDINSPVGAHLDAFRSRQFRGFCGTALA